MVILALRVPSNSVSLLHGFAPCLHTSFPICLLKSSCNSYPTSTCLMTDTLRVLESRVFLHYLIKIILFLKPFFFLKNLEYYCLNLCSLLNSPYFYQRSSFKKSDISSVLILYFKKYFFINQ